MKKIFFLTIAYLYISTALNAQTDTIYMNDNNEKTYYSFASYMRIRTVENDLYKIADYTLAGSLKMTGYIQMNDKSEIKQGYFQYFDTDGILTMEGEYKDNKEEGVWKNYKDSNKLWYTQNYKKGKLNGEFIAYFPDGKIKRKDLYAADTLVSGHCYATSGADTTYFKFRVYAECKELESFLEKNLEYPDDARDKEIQGTVRVKFIINTDGTISNIKIIKGVCSSINNHVLVLMKKMPLWTPGQVDGEIVKMHFVLPIVFSL